MGIFPTRLISSPHVAQDLSTHVLAPRGTVGHQALRRGQDGHAQPAHHTWNRPRLGVHPQTRLGHALDPADGALLVAAVPEREHQAALRLVALDAIALDVALR